MEAKKHISELHSEHFEWLDKLSFNKDEIQVFNKRLGEILKANNVREVAAQVEHFQNQFIRQREVIDELRHEIKQYENNLTKQVEANPVASDHRFTVDHPVLRDQMETYEKIYSDLKTEFNHFLSKTL
ncbi:MAG: hypothetical protein WCO54_10615 [Bacteroidota bacterium]